MALAQPGTPPSSPNQSEHIATWSNAHQFIDVLKAIVDMQIASAPAPKCACFHTSAESQTFQASAQPLTVDHLEQLISKLIDAKSKPPEASKDAKPGDPQPETARASKLEFKTVNEVWNEKENKYKIEESSIAKGSTYDEYVFVRTRIDKDTKELTFYVDVNSEELRDILREVLKDVYGVSLMEDKPSVERNLLYHYLPELESHRSSLRTDAVDAISTKHSNLLIDCIKEIYMPTTQRLLPLLKHGEITYDLLPMLFKPNTTVYTTCLGTRKPRCVTYDSGEEKTSKSKAKYFSMDCRYFDFDGKTFGKTSTTLIISNFRGTKRINTLEAFPLKHHRDEIRVKSELIECGRKFVSLIGTHHCYSGGEAFFMDDGDLIRVTVDSRIMIDADFFWKMNPNYSRPRADLAETGWRPPGSHRVKGGVELADLKEDELLICCPTVLGFSLGEKLWVEFAVADIEDIKWSPSPYDCLSISDEQRDIIMALVEAHVNPRMVFDDFVTGKGKGLIMLLQYGSTPFL
ncbi:hypothetical protein IFR05_016902 [Cadophora sp. M221]|nr:hypothetical protein IFR05_016902 [Cadophora sp. M221]